MARYGAPTIVERFRADWLADRATSNRDDSGNSRGADPPWVSWQVERGLDVDLM